MCLFLFASSRYGEYNNFLRFSKLILQLVSVKINSKLTDINVYTYISKEFQATESFFKELSFRSSKNFGEHHITTNSEIVQPR